ncbi:MAG: hypothetical protein HUJ65_00370 [Oscillospiraceae bacterium]|nr:hypothetical protein [Oscillospiraceae bacterium]
MGLTSRLIGNVFAPRYYSKVGTQGLTKAQKLHDVGVKAGEMAVQIPTEATVFALPDVMFEAPTGEYRQRADGTYVRDEEGNKVPVKKRKEFFESFEEALPMVLGFKMEHAVKAAIGNYEGGTKAEPDARVQARVQKGYWDRMFDRVFNEPETGFTKQELDELERAGYGDIKQWTSKKGINTVRDAMAKLESGEEIPVEEVEGTADGATPMTKTVNEYYDTVERALADGRISEKTRSK